MVPVSIMDAALFGGGKEAKSFSTTFASRAEADAFVEERRAADPEFEVVKIAEVEERETKPSRHCRWLATTDGRLAFGR